MTGGIIQIISIGNQDKYLIDNNISYFNFVYYKYRSFSRISKKIEINSRISYNSEIIINIPKYADLINNMFIQIDLPDYKWINNIGNYILKYISIFFDSINIDYYTLKYNDIDYELNHDKNKNINNLINVSDNKIIIPLKFWFCKNNNYSIPIISLKNTKITLRAYINKINTLIQDYDVNVVYDDIKIKLIIDYIILDNDDRYFFLKNDYEYLIEQHKKNGPKLIKSLDLDKYNTINIKLNFNNQIKDIFWIITKSDVIQYLEYDFTFTLDGNQIFNYLSNIFSNYIIPYEKYKSTPKKGINVYSFSLYPNKYQPSGSINFNLVNYKFLKLKFKKKLTENYYIHIFSRSYNILQISKGNFNILF